MPVETLMATLVQNQTIETDDFRYLPVPLNYSVDTYIARNNCDTRIPNGFGNKLLDLCKNTRLRIANGRFLVTPLENLLAIII